MKSEGHHDAGQYPAWLVAKVTQMARQRINNFLVSETVLTHQMLASALLGGDSSRTFNETLQKLRS